MNYKFALLALATAGILGTSCSNNSADAAGNVAAAADATFTAHTTASIRTAGFGATRGGALSVAVDFSLTPDKGQDGDKRKQKTLHTSSGNFAMILGQGPIGS